MNRVGKVGVLVLLAFLATVLAGCSNKVMDPAQIGRFRPAPAVNVILDSLGVAEETPLVWASAEEPKPSDLITTKGDYTLRAGDQVSVSIFELFQEGVTVGSNFVVSETGKISIPSVGVIQAAGLTETQLEDEIKEILSPGTLKNPSVTVALISSQQRTFSILGDGVPQPNRYTLPRYDFRLTDALATAGGPMQFNVSHIYVARAQGPRGAMVQPSITGPTTDELELIMPGTRDAMPPLNSVLPTPVESSVAPQRRDIPDPSQPAEKFELKREMLEMISPQAKRQGGGLGQTPVVRATSRPVAAESDLPSGFRYVAPVETPTKALRSNDTLISASMVDQGDQGRAPVTQASAEGRTEWIFRDGKWVEIPVQNAAAQPLATSGRTAVADEEVQWVLRDNQWVPVRQGQGETAERPVATQPPTPSRPIEQVRLPGESEWEQAIQTRLIKIPAKELLAGDPRYNIVIKPGDTIHVPVDIIGEFCITGNVNRGGFINLTGRPMTLKMAIAAAGGLGPLAWPKYCEVVRRIGEKKEEIVMVDLDKIASGEQPDFFIKPNDLINVGTHPTSRWRAVLRNAFRAAYGFGFVYDRNFAYSEDSYGTSFF